MMSTLANLLNPRTIIKAVAAGTFASMMALSAQAALVSSSNGSFEIVYDDSAAGLLGRPTVSGNFLSFSPTQFFAQQVNSGFDFERATFNFRVNLMPGWRLNSVLFRQEGDFWQIGLGSSANVSIGGQLRVFDLDQPIRNTGKDTLTELTNAQSRNTSGTVDWVSSAFVDMRAASWSATDSVSITIESLLLGHNSPGGLLAFIEQKFSAVELNVVQVGAIDPVPEPEQWLMMVGGLAVLVGASRRNRRKA